MATNNKNETENSFGSSDSENEEIFRIRKQTRVFRISSNLGENRSWSVQLKCLDSQNEKVSRLWYIKAKWKDNWLTIKGEDTTYEDCKYVESFCSVDVYVNKWRKLCSYQLPLKGPYCREFAFNEVANWNEIEKAFKPPVLPVLIMVKLGIEEDTIDGVVPLELDNFMNNKFLSDCVIKTERKDFPCHKVLLAAKSEYFKAMFSSGMKEANENRIDWTTVFEADTVYDLLYFIYTAKIPRNIDNTCVNLIHAAYLCSLKDLQEICGERLERLIKQENAVEILLIAKKYEIMKLKEVAIDFIAPHREEILKTTAWNETNAEVARDLFSAAMDVISQNKVKK